MKWNVSEIPKLKGYCIEWAEQGNYILSKRNRLYHAESLGGPLTFIAEIDAPLYKKFASRFRLGQRLLRFMVTNVIPLRDGGIFVSFDKSVGIVRDGVYRALAGLVRPCRILRSAVAMDANGDLYFGEYLANDERGEIRIYRLRSGADSLEVAYTFPAGEIKHIHGIYFDRITSELYCLTGDAPSECRILKTKDGFRSIETVGSGDESWRAVSMLFEEDAIYYGTDAEFRSNNIYRFERSTGERTDLGSVSGTVFYSKRFGGNLFFATTAENAPSQEENVAAIYVVDPSRVGDDNKTVAGDSVGSDSVAGDTVAGEGVAFSKPVEIARFPKDIWHPTLFMFGTIHFPTENLDTDRLYFHIVGAKGDAISFEVQRG
jgi:hypothetical protein